MKNKYTAKLIIYRKREIQIPQQVSYKNNYADLLKMTILVHG